MNREIKPGVVLFSDANFLAVNILETLLSQNCVVYIVSDDKQKWGERTTNITSTSRFSIIGIGDYKNLSNFSYAIFCGGFLKKEKALTDFKKFISNKNFGTAKTLALFPFETFSLKASSKIAISDNAGIIYLGDLMGPRMDLESDLLLPTLIREMFTQRTVTLGVGEIFYPIFVADAVRTIVKWLLSFGPYGKDTFLIGRQVSSSDFWKQNLKSFPDLKVLYDTNKDTRFIPKGYEIVTVNSNLNICLNETYKWLIQKNIASRLPKIKRPPLTKTKIKFPQKPKVRRPSKLRFLKPYLLPAFLILFFPVFTAIVSAGILFMSYKQFLSENINGAVSSALLAKTVLTIGKGESDIIGYVPILGRVFKETSYINGAGIVAADLSVNAIPMAESGRTILGGVLGTGVYDVKTPSLEIKTNLESIFRRISLFQIATENSAGDGVLTAKQILQIVDFDKLENLTRQGSILAANLPSILGQDSDKNYLILFENNMELRPTGGFIGSYGVANFGGGKLNGLNINDIYSADGQLKGHVEPPMPIKKYLGEANWWFRDSNWNPDFPTSAERAEWFLDKEMGQPVDGVIAIDLEPIKEILNYTGPIFLPDYNLTITPTNLYEKTQEEAQANSFPGSRQKASFLTALSQAILADVPKLNSKNRILVLKTFYESLAGRHVQVYLHDADSAAALESLSWDGKIKTYSCGDSCYSDFFGDVEANVGVNKSNYFVSRKISFNVNINSDKIVRQLTLSLTNSANPSLGPSGIYKSYLRVMIPMDAEVATAQSVTGQSVTILSPDITQENGRQEVGVYVEVTPGQTQTLRFDWASPIPEGDSLNSYGLYVRKQAGVGGDPLTVNFSGAADLASSPVFALTQGGSYGYNTTLAQDFFARMSWGK